MAPEVLEWTSSGERERERERERGKDRELDGWRESVLEEGLCEDTEEW
jgi:hypothetical protein